MANDNEVGYAKPPKDAQWKPGQSGNPSGRPKGRSDLLQEAAAILSEPVTARTPDGTSISLGALEGAYLSFCKKALKGHDPSLYAAIKIMFEVMPDGEDKQANAPALLLEAKREFARKLGIEWDAVVQEDDV
ncbi:MAG: DUF5681 domain-containing protein [Thermohalobaculum sp.]